MIRDTTPQKLVVWVKEISFLINLLISSNANHRTDNRALLLRCTKEYVTYYKVKLKWQPYFYFWIDISFSFHIYNVVYSQFIYKFKESFWIGIKIGTGFWWIVFIILLLLKKVGNRSKNQKKHTFFSYYLNLKCSS